MPRAVSVMESIISWDGFTTTNTRQIQEVTIIPPVVNPTPHESRIGVSAESICPIMRYFSAPPRRRIFRKNNYRRRDEK